MLLEQACWLAKYIRNSNREWFVLGVLHIGMDDSDPRYAVDVVRKADGRYERLAMTEEYPAKLTEGEDDAATENIAHAGHAAPESA